MENDRLFENVCCMLKIIPIHKMLYAQKTNLQINN